MGQRDLASDRQAQAGSLRLGGEEWFEQVRQDLVREARPVVGNARRNGAACRVEAGRQPEHPASRHDLQGVGRQVTQDLHQSRRGHLDRGQIGLEVELDANLLLAGAVLGEARGLGRHNVEVARGEILGVGPRELQKP